MKGMIFKKAFLLGGIFLLATFMLAQSSWGCDDDDKDKRDCDHHDKWDCHKQCQPPKIQSVDVDLENKEIVIHGENFNSGANPPVVTLGGSTKLEILTYTGNEIVAELPVPEDIPNSDYRLVVSTCHDSACKDKYCKDHGPNCKCKYCRDHCSKCKDKYCKENGYKCRCKDRYSLTILGPSGQLGTIGSVIVTTDGKQISTSEFEGYALCDQGYTATGGGFKSINLKIAESRPDGNGWYVLGRIAFDKETEPTLTIYAVCARIR